MKASILNKAKIPFKAVQQFLDSYKKKAFTFNLRHPFQREVLLNVFNNLKCFIINNECQNVKALQEIFLHVFNVLVKADKRSKRSVQLGNSNWVIEKQDNNHKEAVGLMSCRWFSWNWKSFPKQTSQVHFEKLHSFRDGCKWVAEWFWNLANDLNF